MRIFKSFRAGLLGVEACLAVAVSASAGVRPEVSVSSVTAEATSTAPAPVVSTPSATVPAALEISSVTAPVTRVVGELAVEGNTLNKKGAILGKMKLRKGDVVVDPTFQADVDRLNESGLFDDVQVRTEDLPQPDAGGRPRVRVVFVVKERWTIRRIDLKGRRALSESKLREALTSKAEEPLDRFKASMDANKLLEVYRDEGYIHATVDFYVAEEPARQRVLLTYFIVEGQRVLVDEVRVSGSQVLSPRKIRRIFKETREKKVFKEDLFEQDLTRLRDAYGHRGYLEAEVSTFTVTTSTGGKVTVSLTVHEGPRYRIGSYAFSGSTIFSDKELTRAMQQKPGERYDKEKMDESEQKLREMYADKGYLRAEITPEVAKHSVSEAEGRVDFQFNIVESAVVYVDRIYVDGNTSTKEKVIRREVLLKEGDVFSAGKVRRSVEKIYNLGFMDDVQVDVQQPRSPHRADLVFNVVEGKPGMLTMGAGYSSVDRIVGNIQVQHGNLFGLGQRISFSWEFGARKQNYDISWTDPWFLDKPMSFGVDLYDTIRSLPFNGDSQAYKRRNRGFGFRLGPRLSDSLSLVHRYNWEEVHIYDIEPRHTGNADETLNITPSNDTKSSVTNGVIYDTRDNYLDASRGVRHSVTAEWAGGLWGGKQYFVKPLLESAVYIPTWWKLVLTLSGRGGVVGPYGPDSQVPFAEKFRIGGVDTVRGYNYGEVGVEAGVAYTVFNAEYKFPIVQERSRTILQGAFFADVGGNWDHVNQVRMKVGSQPRQMNSGVGFGIRFKTPVFPIRLDWGYGLNTHPGQSKSQFYFTIGNIF